MNITAYIIAVAGKGGVGKTSISALLVRTLASLGRGPVLAVDADPNSNLHEKLGMPPGKTVGKLREEITASIENIPKSVSKTEQVSYGLRTIVTEGRGFDLLEMGRQEGPGCYCYINNLLRELVDTLSDKYAFVVIDNEAGMEHLSRRTSRKAEILLIVSDSSPTGIRTAERLSQLASEMGIKIGKKVLLVNRLPGGNDGLPSLLNRYPHINAKAGGTQMVFDAIQALPEDTELNNYNSESKSLMELPAGSAAYSGLSRLVRDAVG